MSTTNTLKIGRNEFSQEDFISAVKASSRHTEVAERLGLNRQVTPHMQAIKQLIEDLQLDTSHFTFTYKKSESYNDKKQAHLKECDTTENNKAYLEAYKKSFDKPTCYNNYKSTIVKFMEFIQKDITDITNDDIQNFLQYVENESTRNNKTAHIKGILVFIVKNNVNNCTDTISRETLITVLSI